MIILLGEMLQLFSHTLLYGSQKTCHMTPIELWDWLAVMSLNTTGWLPPELQRSETLHIYCLVQHVDSLGQHESSSTLAQIMAYSLSVPSYYLHQC